MRYINPILKGFNPDPSICRVGEDYYLVTSTFEYFPGIPVYHSRDLVNWNMIGHCIERAEQLPLEDVKSSGGIWAPVIRFYEGKFYVTASFDGIGNFIVSSDDPSKGWSNPVWTDFSGIDPSMFFENGKMYYCANDIGERLQSFGSEGVSLAETDMRTGKVIGEIKRIWTGGGGGWIEAPHIYHIGEYYYIIAAEGGTGSGHHEIAGRSKSIWGPYENCPENPILTNRNDTSRNVSCSGHGDIVDDVNGNWWMVHLGTRNIDGMSHLGRETFLMPLIWKNNWFSVGENKKSYLEADAPLWNNQEPITELHEDFSDGKIGKEWFFRRIPNMENYTTENGMLILKPTTVKLSDSCYSPTFMAVRPLDLKFCAETKFEFNTNQDGDCAGLTIYLNENFYYRICKKREGGLDYIIFERRNDDVNIVVYRKEVKSDVLKMKITTDEKKYHFYYSVGKEYIEAGCGSVKYLSTNIAGKCFTGDVIALFTECEAETSASMRIYDFTQTALEKEIQDIG